MKQHLFHSMQQLCSMAALLLCAATTAWGQTTTYRLQQVTSVQAGGLYVFEQTYNGTSYVIGNTITSNALNTKTSYKTSGLTGSESYVWTLETAKNGFYMKNVNVNTYLNNTTTSSTNMSLDGTPNSNWAFNFQSDNTVMIQNTSNDNRFLGFGLSGGVVTTKYKAYSPGTINEDSYLHAIKVFQLVDERSVTLNSNGYATFSCTHDIDFSTANDYTAWQITGVSGDAITFEQITGAVAAGTGVLLKGTPHATLTLSVAASGDDISSTNKLEGITSATAVADNTYYGLSGNEFVPVNAGTVPAGKALLPKSVVEGTNVKALTFVFENATGIVTVEKVSTRETTEIFNLAGQRLNKLQRGVNIVNGKKVLVKFS